MTNINVLVIGLWGYPGGWHRARYIPVVPNDKRCVGKPSCWVPGEGIDSYSTTIVEAVALKRLGFEIHLRIYGLDTLATPPRPSSGKQPGKAVEGDPRAKLVEEVGRRVEGSLCSDHIEYNDVVEVARWVLERFTDMYTKEVGEQLAASVSVLPGIGVYRACSNLRRFVYRGSPLNTYAALLIDLADALNCVDPDLVVLDISHGVNYLPVLGREAVHKSIRLYSALRGKKVVVAVVNSDPVQEPGQSSHIHLVELRTYEEKPLELFESTVSDLSMEELKPRALERVEPPKEIQELSRVIDYTSKSYTDLMNALTRASSYGLVLYILTRMAGLDLGELERDISSLEGKVKDALYSRSVRLEGDSVTVEHKYAVTPGVVDLLSALRLLKRLREAIKLDFKAWEGWVELELLEKLGGELGLSRIASKILMYEVQDIEKHVNALETLGVDLSKPLVYNTIIQVLNMSLEDAIAREKLREVLMEAEHKARSRPEQRCQANERHFYAHAGLERNIVEVKKQNGKIYIRYIPACLELINEIIAKGG
ncbi:MAG: TM1812 family CRISPR-associated protein [Ignisphaera sp.]